MHRTARSRSVGPPQFLRYPELDRVEMGERIGIERHPWRGTTAHLQEADRAADLLEAAKRLVERLGVIRVEVATDGDERALDGGHARTAVGVAAHLVQATNDSLAVGESRPRSNERRLGHPGSLRVDAA